ncbi:MAG TPA: 5'/3'-nucleotidase SurE [Polyangia bacterium]|nr:5'/3'-nucleotidase SurE [Polyangia bacterium]
MSRPLILLANDDGIQSAGIRALGRRLADLGDLVVVAPDRERSATSHAFTLNHPLRCDELEPGWFSVDGTPADCVYLGILEICPRKPDLVVSGINHGFNLGSDVFYSGTVAGAVEAALRDVPAIAMSLEWKRGTHEGEAPFTHAAEFAHALARAVLQEGLPTGTLLNVNVPSEASPTGYHWTKLGKRIYRDQVDARADLRGRRYYWIGGPAMGYGDVAGSDCHAVRDGHVSVTPLDLDLTHAGLLERLPAWNVDGFDRVVGRDLDGQGLT